VTSGNFITPEEFGDYLVYERLGMGGMATVHRAKKRGIEGFERVVALKRLLDSLVDDESFVRSFVREARLASYLQHANVVQIYDLGKVGNVYYIAMEYVRGRDLRQILRQARYASGAPPIQMTLAILWSLCDALDYAHNLRDESGEPLGIVHRDVSPSNLIVAHDGHLKVIDFGIAGAQAVGLRTQSGMVKGKFAYMAPEIAGGRAYDRRSDLFAAGIIGWELLCARPLFASKTDYETLDRVRRLEVPPPSTYNPQCPRELDEIVMTALARDPDMRWQSAAAMRKALDMVAAHRAQKASTREIADWLDWAFSYGPAPDPVRVSRQITAASAPGYPLSVLGAPFEDEIDEVSIQIVWGPGDAQPSSLVSIEDLGQQAGTAAVTVQSRPPWPDATPHGASPAQAAYPAAPPAQPEPPAAPPAQPEPAPADPSAPAPGTIMGVAPPPAVLRDYYRKTGRHKTAELPEPPDPDPGRRKR